MRMPLMIVAAVSCIVLIAAPKLSAQRPQVSRSGTVLVDMGKIMQQSARFNQAMERLKAEYEAKAQELKKDGDRGNQLTEQLRSMPANNPQRKQLEQEILKLRADYELRTKRVTEDTRETESKIILGLVGELRGELERFARANGIQLVLRYDPTPDDLSDPRMILQEIQKPIVYQRDTEVTAAVIDLLNRGAQAARPTNPSPSVPR